MLIPEFMKSSPLIYPPLEKGDFRIIKATNSPSPLPTGQAGPFTKVGI
jgi:hypothetical protein